MGRKSIEISPGVYITIGQVGVHHSLIIKTNDAGNLLLQKKIYTNMYCDQINIMDFIRVSDFGYLFCGSASYLILPNNSDSLSTTLIKTDSAFNVTWDKSFGPAHPWYGSAGYKILPSQIGGYLVGGGINAPYGYSSGDIFLIKTDINGDALCNQVNVICATDTTQIVSDSAAVLSSGMIVNNDTLTVSAYLLNDTLLCQIPTGLQTQKNKHDPIIFPNPASEDFVLSLHLETEQTIEIYVSDISGKKVFFQSVLFNYGKNERHINISNLKSGIYIISIVTKTETFNRKILIY